MIGHSVLKVFLFNQGFQAYKVFKACLRDYSPDMPGRPETL